MLIKARAGGGGKGMRKVDSPDAFAALLDSAVREAVSAFGDGHVIIEKYITAPRHIEGSCSPTVMAHICICLNEIVLCNEDIRR